MKSRIAPSGPLPGSISVSASHLEDRDAAILDLQRRWDAGDPPSIGDLWQEHGRREDLDVLAALIKADIQARFARGETPEVASYLARFAPLRAARERVVSLVYEEFCLREEAGERLDPERFCDRYDPWRDSLLSQLRYHFLLSQAVGAMPKARPLPGPGERFRTFRLGPVLGQGGSARVFLAHDELLGDRRVALKVSTDRGKEPAIQGRLDHEHIVPVLSVTDDPETGLRGLCMPYRAGLPLDEIIRRVDPASRPQGASALREALLDAGKGIDPEEPAGAGWRGFPSRGSYPDGVAWVVSVVARALAYAHAQKVLHRDVKPANVLLTAREGPQLLDFNLSHSPHTADRAEAALRGGTLPYMAPEQLLAFLNPEGWGDVGEAADIYSVGLLLRELLTGRRPDSPPESAPLPRAIRELLDRRVRGFGPARALNPDVSHGLDAILARCLAYRPEDRYTSAQALADDLRRYLDRQPLAEAVNPSRRERLANWARRNKVWRVAMLVPAVALVTSAWYTLRERPDNARFHAYAGAESTLQGKADEGLKEAEASIRKRPEYFRGYWVKALALIGLKKYDDALKMYDQAVLLARAEGSGVTPEDQARVLADRAGLLHSMKRRREAEVDYRDALDLSDTSFTALAGLGQIAQEQGDVEEARTLLTHAIDLALKKDPRPDFILFKCYRIRAQASVKDGQRALQDEDLALSRSAFDLARGDVERAEREADQHARRLKLGDADLAPLVTAKVMTYFGLGDLEDAEGNAVRARQHWTTARSALDRARNVMLKAEWVREYKRLLAERLQR